MLKYFHYRTEQPHAPRRQNPIHHNNISNLYFNNYSQQNIYFRCAGFLVLKLFSFRSGIILLHRFLHLMTSHLRFACLMSSFVLPSYKSNSTIPTFCGARFM